MSFGTLNLAFGTLGVIGGRLGDSTALTTAHAAALFPDAVRSGAQLHYPTAQEQQAGGYVEIAANTVPLFPAFVDECAAWYLAIVPQGQAVNLNLHSNDLTHSGYVKTGCTVEVVAGGLAGSSGPEVVINGDFATGDLTGFIDVNDHWSVVDGRAYHASSSAFNMLLFDCSSLQGQQAVISFQIIRYFGFVRAQFRQADQSPIVSANYLWGAGGGEDAIDVSGIFSQAIVVPENAVYIAFARDTATITEFSVDNISLKQADFFHSRVTATVANATLVKSIPRASALRGTKVIGRATGVVRASQGDVTGSELKTNHNFATNDLTGWTDSSTGTGTVDASSGAAVLTSDGSTNAARISGSITTVAGKRYRLTFVSSAGLYVQNTGAAAITTGNINTALAFQEFIATTDAVSFQLTPQGNASPFTLTSFGIKEVIETTIPETFTELDLAPYTGANPQLAFRFDDEAILELYDWVHEELAADTPMFRNFRPIAGVSETVGPFSSGNTIASPATINITALVQAPPAGARDYVVATWYTAADTNVRLQVLFNAGNLILRRNASTDVTIATGIAAGDTCLIDVEWTATDIRGRLDLGAWATHTHEAIPAFDRMRIGSDHTPANHLSALFVAFKDNAQTLGLAKDGWNHSAIDCVLAYLPIELVYNGNLLTYDGKTLVYGVA